MINTSRYSPLLLVLAAVLLVLSLIPAPQGPVLEMALARAGLEKVHDAALDHLRIQREQAFKGFLVLSGLKIALAVLRSSEVGLILNIRIGDLAVAAYDYVNLGWKVLLAAVAYFYLAEYLLVFVAHVDIWFLQLALASLVIILALGRWYPRRARWMEACRRIGIVSTVLALLLYLGLPFSFIASGWVASRITGESLEESGRLLEDTRKGIPGFQAPGPEGEEQPVRTPRVTVPFPYDGSDPSQVTVEDAGGERGPGHSGAVAFSGDQLRRLKTYLENRSRAMALAVLRQTSAYLFNIVLVPLLSLVVLYWGTRFMISLFLPMRIDPAR